jgi:ankyrin repeat protein
VNVKADYKIVRLLVKYYEEGVNAKNNLGDTPLETAKKMEQVDWEEDLLELLEPLEYDTDEVKSVD